MEETPSIDFKFVETYFKDKFLRPFARRLKYIYFGLDCGEDIFVLSDTEDIEFKYCEALQTTGLIKIKNKEHLDKISLWFDSLKIDRTSPCIFYLGKIMPILNKIKWDDPSINISKDRHGTVFLSITDSGVTTTSIIARTIDTHFTLIKLQSFVDKYTKVFFENDGFYYDEDFDLNNNKSISTISISCLKLYEVGVLDVVCEDIRLVLLSGLDVLISKSLIIPNNHYRSGVRLWADNGKKCLNYGGFYDDVDVSICTSRDNIFIFPKIKKKE